MQSQDLPLARSSDLHLVLATPEQHRAQWRINAAEWQGPLSVEAYLRREEFLLEQLNTRDGGLTPWLLVHQPGGPTGDQQVLCGCESYKKRALVSRDGNVQEVVCHGVGSVFCPAKNRGKGYAGRMMDDLAKKLENWQAKDSKVLFSVLFSDIGKDFYTLRGWQAFPSAHISLEASSSNSKKFPSVKLIKAAGLPALCARDEQLLRSHLARVENGQQKTRVATIPDVDTILWHKARADFFAKELFDTQVDDVGAIAEYGAGKRVWCYWHHRWSSKDQQDQENKLYILRLVVENDLAADFIPAGEETIAGTGESEESLAIAAVLAAAQAEAKRWNLGHVEVWNPSTKPFAAARLLDPSVKVQHRDTSSITSLLWYGEGTWEGVDWVCNERYGWC